VPGFLPVLPYTTVVDGVSMPFEAVSGTSEGRDYVYEPAPQPSGAFNLLYRNDQLGFGSDNTGFFFLFKQGVLQNQDFNLAEAIPNRTVNINIEGINDQDHWLYKLDDLGSIAGEWEYVENIYSAAVEQLAPDQRRIYGITSRANDQITLTFGDGVFAETPVGLFLCTQQQRIRIHHQSRGNAEHSLVDHLHQPLWSSRDHHVYLWYHYTCQQCTGTRDYRRDQAACPGSLLHTESHGQRRRLQ
jgi:hypothetical protein